VGKNERKWLLREYFTELKREREKGGFSLSSLPFTPNVTLNHAATTYRTTSSLEVYIIFVFGWISRGRNM